MNKKLQQTLSGVFILGVLASPSCTLKQMVQLAKETKPVVEPSPIELHGDSANAIISAELPVKMLKKNTTYTIESYYRPTNGEAVKTGEVKIVSNDYYKGKKKPTTNPKIELKSGLLYADEYKQGKLEVKGTAEKGGKTKDTPVMPLEGGEGVITTSRLVQPTYYVNYVPHGYEYKEEYEPIQVPFFFEKGRSVLRRSEKKSDRAQNLEGYIGEKNATKTVTITGMHSPEGSETINSNLSQERADVIKKYYTDLMEKYDYNKDSVKFEFIIKPVIQSWIAFKELLNDNERLTEDQKAEILRIVDGPGDFVSKELKLQTLKSYRILVRDIYPPLRTARTEILKIKEKLTEAEIIVLGQKIGKGEEDASKLKEEELAYAASNTPDLKEKEAIYLAATKKSGSGSSYNNLGAVYMDMASKATSEEEVADYYKKAVSNFELALKKEEVAEAFVNLAGAKLMMGDEAGAEEAINKVKGASGSVGNSVSAIKGYFYIKKGKYDEAIQFLSGGGSDAIVLYNKALAYLLKSSKEIDAAGYPKAESAFTDAIDGNNDNAYAYYGAAITAARLNKESDMAKFLAKAVSANAELKERAVSDLEFKKYWANPTFKGALK